MTIYIGWAIGQYELIFEVDGTVIDTRILDYNQIITDIPNPSKQGHAFVGWQPLVPNKMPAQNLTVEAVFEINVYTVTFDLDGGFPQMPPIDIEYQQKLTKPRDPDKEGYIFDNWLLGETVYDFELFIIENVALKAMWIKEETPATRHLVNFDSDGGSVVEPQNIRENTSAYEIIPTKAGFSFEGWFLGEALFNFETPIAKAITLTAKWEKLVNVHFYTMTPDIIETQGIKKGTLVTKPTDPILASHDFIEWRYNGAMFDFNTPVFADIVLEAAWTLKKSLSH